MANYPDTNAEIIAEQFTEDLVQNRPEWNLLDVVHFFKWIRNAGATSVKVLGNKINVVKLNEYTFAYAEQRAEARERQLLKQKEAELYEKTKETGIDLPELPAGQIYVKDAMLKLSAELEDRRLRRLQKAEAELQDRRTKTVTYHKLLEAYKDEIRVEVEAGNITEVEADKRIRAYMQALK